MRQFFPPAAAICLLLAGIAAEATDPVERITHVVLIGGFDSDPTLQQLDGVAARGVGNSGLYQLRGDLLKQRVSADYFNWNGTTAGHIHDDEPPGPAAIVQHISRHAQRNPQSRLAIVGNSMGGHTAWDVCDGLDKSTPRLPVQLVVFLDPSSVARPGVKRPEKLPANVVAGVQYASRTVVIWRPWPDEPRMLHIDLGDDRSGFLRPDGPAYNAAFNANAHIGAEWDEMIHADICRRLVGGDKPQPKILR